MIPSGTLIAQRGRRGLGTVPKFPVITGSTAVSLNENIATVGTYTADEAVTWSLAGTDAARFTISTGGVLSFVAAPDFEAPSDANGDNVYLVTVRAVNASEGNMSSLNVIVTVLDVAVEGPVITGSSTPSINENTTAVFTYTADRTVTWSINGGADAAKFTINSSGLLSFITAPDFEAPSDADINNIYVVGVRATDTLSRATTLMVAVTVLDVAVELVPGQSAYTSDGTYSWIAPSACTSVSAVCVGPGASGSTGGGSSGGGGALAYKNAISVTPGTSYTVVVGTRGRVAGTTTFSNGTITISAGGGNYNTGGSPGGTYDGGGAGGNADFGAGGAGGYTGVGGSGGTYYLNGGNGAGGGGGGGGGGAFYDEYTNNTYRYKVGASGGGGGVGIKGQGENGVGGMTYGVGDPSQAPGTGGTGGSGGGSGSSGGYYSGGQGGHYGGGGGSGAAGANLSYYSGSGSVGGFGAVRLMWGAGRAYPSTNAGDV